MLRRYVVLGFVCAAIACGVEIADIPAAPIEDPAEGGADATGALDGLAGDCSNATWKTSFPTVAPRALAVDGSGRLFAAGNDGNEVWVAELDRCSGAVVRERRFAPDTRRASISAILATDGEILLTGHSGNGGLGEDESGSFFRLDKNLGEIDRQLVKGAGWSDLSRLAVAADGTVWLGGVVRIFDAANQAGWVVRPGDGGCAVNLGQSVTGLATVPGGDNALAAIQTDAGTTALVELSKCKIGKLTPVPVPAVGAPSHLLRTASGDHYLVGAMGGAFNSDKAWLAGRRPDTGWAFAEPIDPNSGADTMARVVTDDQALFTAGNQNQSFETGTATVYRYALPLLSGAVPEWTTLAFGADLLAISDLQVTPAAEQGLFVSGIVPGNRPGGAIARCRKSTGCPQ